MNQTADTANGVLQECEVGHTVLSSAGRSTELLAPALTLERGGIARAAKAALHSPHLCPLALLGGSINENIK
jgi:hypothetical protein